MVEIPGGYSDHRASDAALPRRVARSTREWWRRNHEYIRTLATVIAAIAGCIALWFNYRAFTSSQRAWVLFDNKAANVTKGDEYYIELYLRNFGHSPALDVKVVPTRYFGTASVSVSEEPEARGCCRRTRR